MFTRLQKALGLKKSDLTDDDKLCLLALKGKCAGDDYYFKMEQSLFDNCMKGDERETFYKYYSRQREVGFQAFQDEVKNDISQCLGIELHTIACSQSFNSGKWFLTHIVEHARCELATALFIYWASQPGYLYRRYGSVENALEDPDSLLYETAKLLNVIEKRAKAEGYPCNLELPNLNCFLDGKQPNYKDTPLDNIPPLLRV